MRWTEQADRELRRLMNYELTYAQIGDRLGCTENAARVRAYKLGWTSYGRAGFVVGRRNSGKKRSPKTIAKMSALMKAKWGDPSFRAKMVAVISSAAAKTERNAKISLAYDTRRGFPIPEEKRDDYRFLVDRKKLPAREAGEVLGLVARAA